MQDVSDNQNFPEEAAITDLDFEQVSNIAKPSQSEKPEEYIAHSVRLDNLRMKLLTEATTIVEIFGEQIGFEPAPGGIKLVIADYSKVGLLEPGTEKAEQFNAAVENILNSYDAENTAVYMHYLDYMAICRRNKLEAEKIQADFDREVADLKENKERQERRLNGNVNGFQFCYGHNFDRFSMNLLLKNKKEDGTWKKGGKSHPTLYGTISLKPYRDIYQGKLVKLEDKEALIAELEALRAIAEQPITDEAGAYIEDADMQAIEAQSKLDRLGVKWTQEIKTVEQLSYDLNKLKALAQEEKLAGFVATPVSCEDGELVIK